MRSLIIVVVTIALANLLAIAGFVGWLRASDRLDMDRLERIRAILAPTRAETAAALAAEQAAAAEAEAARARQAHAQLPPILAADRVAALDDRSEIAAQREERLRREVEDLRRTLDRERAELDARILAFEKRVAEFDAMRKRIAEQEGDEQFRKAVALYESLPPAKAQELLQTLVEQGQTDQVVSYLDAMEPRAAKKVLEKFTDARLAADLLERLRTLGMEPGAASP